MYIPYKDRLIIKKVAEESSSIVIPSSVNTEEKSIGEIMEVPEGNNDFKKGTKIIYDECAGMYIPGSKELIIITFDDILAVIKE